MQRNKQLLPKIYGFFLFSLMNLGLNAKENSHFHELKSAKEVRDLGNKHTALAGVVDSSYDQFYPYYVKYCSVTQFNPFKGKGLIGSKVGHAAFYLKGVCKDPNQLPSGLKMCENSNLEDPNTGVGISVDRGLKNANFLVIPTLRTFLSGDLNRDENLTLPVKNRLVKNALDAGVFSKVIFHDFMFPSTLLDEHKERFIATYVFGSDYAFSLARNLYCVNVPIPKNVMSLVVDELNTLNESYKNSVGKPYRGFKKKDPDYHWNGYWDNCTHTFINAFAKVGILTEKQINLNIFEQLWHIAVPANTLLDLHERSNLMEFNIEEIYQKPLLKDLFLKYNWLPIQEGVLSEFVNFYKKNEVFQGNDDMFVLPHIFKGREKLIREMSRNPVFSAQGEGAQSLIPNLIYFNRRYIRAIEQLKIIFLSKHFEKEYKNANQPRITFLETQLEKIENILASDPTKEHSSILDFKSEFEEELLSKKNSLDYIDFMKKMKNFLNQKTEETERKISEIFISR